MSSATTPRQARERARGTAGATLKQQLVDDLGAMIVSGDIEPGTVLQLEAEAARWGVSLSVVREAVSVLASLCLVESRRRLGTTVRARSDWSHTSPEIIAWKLRDPAQRADQFRWLVELRQALEPSAAWLAAGHRSDEAAARLLVLAQLLDDSAHHSDLPGFLEADTEFHELVFEQSGNPLFSGMAQQMDVVLSARHHFGLMPPTPDLVAVRFHEQVAAAIAQRNPDEARAASARIVEHAAREFLEDVISRSPGAEAATRDDPASS